MRRLPPDDRDRRVNVPAAAARFVPPTLRAVKALVSRAERASGVRYQNAGRHLIKCRRENRVTTSHGWFLRPERRKSATLSRSVPQRRTYATDRALARIKLAESDLLQRKFRFYFSTIQIEERCQFREEGGTDTDVTRGSHAPSHAPSYGS